MNERLEGTGASQLVQLIRRIGANTDVTIELATVTSPPPALRIKVDGMKIELESDDLIVAERLTAYSRTVTLNDGEPVTLAYGDELLAGDRVIVASVNSGQLYVILDKAVVYGAS